MCSHWDSPDSSLQNCSQEFGPSELPYLLSQDPACSLPVFPKGLLPSIALMIYPASLELALSKTPIHFWMTPSWEIWVWGVLFLQNTTEMPEFFTF